MADFICKTLKEQGLIQDDIITALRLEQQKVQRNHYLFAVVNFYLVNSKTLVEKMNAQGADWNYAAEQAQRSKVFYDQQKFLDSWVVFCDLICAMMDHHWPDCDDRYWKSGRAFYNEGKARLAAGKRIDDGSFPTPA